MKKSLKITVFGKVHGVGFREYIRRVAEKYAIQGTVQNSPNETIVIYALGTDDELESLVDAIYVGPPKSEVRDVLSESFSTTKDFRGVFRVIGGET